MPTKKKFDSFADEELDRLNKEYDGLLNETVSLAEKLSNEEKKVASDFEKKRKKRTFISRYA